MATARRFTLEDPNAVSESDRRQHPRLVPSSVAVGGSTDRPGAPRLNLAFQRNGAWEPVIFRLLDVSFSGMGLVSQQPLSAGERIRASLRSHGDIVQIDGHVRYAFPVDGDGANAGFRCGIAFDDIKPSFVNLLAESV